MEGNNIETITKFATPKQGLDDVFRKKMVIDLDNEKSEAMNLFGLEKK